MVEKIWIFDLDDTLHNASAHIFPAMNRAMTEYIMRSLSLDEGAAHKLRQHYWQVYGATLKGLVRHHGGHPTYFCPHHFLKETHRFDDLSAMVIQTKRLRNLLRSLPGKKLVFTNAPREYALRVLEILGIHDQFSLIFSVESTKFHAKPSVRGFQHLFRVIRKKASDCIMLEDSLPALMTAKRLGMKTIWVSKRLYKPPFVQYRIPSVLALTHIQV
ncbi:MAG: pyrimidine 5'-nucleotidase [Betaproteobacteria bacterium]|nr:pyrimidine 5'-nucleotidase [Betaproteobacteria bacterium]